MCEMHTPLFDSELITEEVDIPREGLGLWGRTHKAFYFSFDGRPSSCDDKNKSSCHRNNIISEVVSVDCIRENGDHTSNVVA